MSERAARPHARNGREGTRPAPVRRSTRRSVMRLPRWHASRPDIVGLSADLAKYTDILPFRDAFPDRFFNVGMAEQNLIAVVGGPCQDRPHGLLHHLWGVRDAARLRFHRDRLRAFQREREDLRRPARPDHGLWRHPPGDRGPRADAHDPGPGRDRSVRRDRDRAGDATPSRRTRARPIAGCCAVSCRACSIPRHRFRIGAGYVLREGGKLGMISTGLMTERALDAADRAGIARHQGLRSCTCRRSSRSTPRSWSISPHGSSAS